MPAAEAQPLHVDVRAAGLDEQRLAASSGGYAAPNLRMLGRR